ncbi:MAG TPA: hypothetical protein PKV16_06770 [Caldisericia bacterium]|nr:hypothetical protein [Caldisericia bacterium]HPF49470.1 hypothetical protein [Caldisericia bacterium]HPI84236.1 hypothetical protein [Caldisericia bacterium]HPQ93469.1 hypothetical protein [Caldisericia bacterium]HRV75525.1 hypothetical protein [Caldisericia bacterium]
MAETVQLYLKSKPDAAEVIKDYQTFLAGFDKTIYTASELEISLYRSNLIANFSEANVSERLMIIKDMYDYIGRRGEKYNITRYVFILLSQVAAIVLSSYWTVLKYDWGILNFITQFWGTKKVFYMPGFVGTLVGFGIVIVLVARKWLERPRHFLSWLVLILNWWIIAVVYGLIVGDETTFWGSLTSYVAIVAFTAIVLGFKRIVGYAILALIILAGFNLTSIPDKLGWMVYPYLVMLCVSIYLQNPDTFDTLLRWTGEKFTSGQAQKLGKETAESVKEAARTVGDAIKQGADMAFEAGKASMGIPSPKKTKLLD